MTIMRTHFLALDLAPLLHCSSSTAACLADSAPFFASAASAFWTQSSASVIRASIKLYETYFGVASSFLAVLAARWFFPHFEQFSAR